MHKHLKKKGNFEHPESGQCKQLEISKFVTATQVDKNICKTNSSDPDEPDVREKIIYKNYNVN